MKYLTVLVFLLVFTLSSSAQKNLTLSDVQKAFETAKLPIDDAITYTAETDPDNQLERPGYYVEKMLFTDTRIEDEIATAWNRLGVPAKDRDERLRLKCRVLVYRSRTDLERHHRSEMQPDQAPDPFAYTFIHKNVVLKIDHALPPKQAGDYEKALKDL